MLSEDPQTTLVSRQRWADAENIGEADCDQVAVEEPLEIRVAHAQLAVLMRTPGHDLDLALGHALGEGVFAAPSQVQRVFHCSIGENADNVVVLSPRPGIVPDLARFSRNSFASSSCGTCGKRSIEQALRIAQPLAQGSTFFARQLVTAPDRLRRQQAAFTSTGAMHAAGLVSAQGEVSLVREDVGRHNAVDKVIGAAARAQLSTTDCALVVSGRVSFEIVQKAVAARIAAIVSVGGATSLAVQFACASRVAIAGFARKGTLSVYGCEGVIK